MKKTLWTMLAMAAALSASAVEVELLKDGQGTAITANWKNPDNRFGIWTDNDNVASWFRATYEESTLSQSVTLSDCGISAEEIQAGMTMTASATVFTYGSGGSYGDGSRICNIKVYEYDANGTVLAVNTVMDKPGVLFDATTFTTNFTLNPDTRSVKYEMNGQDVVNWQNLYGPAFRNCSMKVTRNSGAYNVTFVSTGTTLEGSLDRPPVASRSGDYTFLGYFTEDGVQVFDANYALVESGLSGLPTDVTLYAKWAQPEGSMATLVYRGQLNLLAGGPAASDEKYTKKMHFRVYDGAEATTPLWKIDDQEVTVNADGSFVHAFGDETLAALIATGRVTHVGLAIGTSASLATELKPRRALRPVAAVNRALTAEGAALDVRVGSLATENALVSADATVSQLEVAGRVTAPGAGKVEVSPLVVGPEERTRLLRGNGVKAFSRAKPTVLATVSSALRGQVLATAPSDGVALISSQASGTRALRCPAVVQYCRKDEKVRAPTSDDGGLKVTFYPFIGKEGN